MTSVAPGRPTVQWIDPLTPDGGPLLAAWADVHAAAERHVLGDAATPWTAAELAAFAVPDGTREMHYAVALSDGQVVGGGRVALTLKDNPDSAQLLLQVHPDRRRRGAGSTLLRALEAHAVERGRSILLGGTQCGVAAEDVDAAFATRHGYAVAQTVLVSSLVLPLDRGLLEDRRDGAGRADAGDYVVETAWDAIPDAWLEDRAELARRMSTDIPLGEMALEEEEWDAERLRAVEARIRRAGRRLVESVARHVASGRLVGYTAYEISSETKDLAYQHDTLVIREHRGHGLGARLKAANTLALQSELPEVRSVRTWNAEENAPMLRVNRELGFEVVAFEREWQKRV